MATKQRPKWAAPPVEKMVSKAELRAKEHDVTCGECGSPMRLRYTKKYERLFYGCSRFPDCTGTHGAHPDGKPFGVPANQETKSARIRAHAAFDQLWKEKDSPMKRAQAYAWMRSELGFQHIGELTKQECEMLCARVLTEFDIDAEDAL